MPNERKQGTYLNGVPELLILRLVAERPMYGYEIVAAIREATSEELNFGEGIIYPILHGLEDEGLLATRRTTFNGRPRVYYRLTRAGGKKLEQSTDQWMRVAQAVRRVLRAQTPGATE